MPRSERRIGTQAETPEDALPEDPAPVSATDWRGWLTLAWALAVSCLYLQMVLSQRGDLLARWLSRWRLF